MPRVEIIEAAKLVARAVEKERLFITHFFSLYRTTFRLKRSRRLASLI